MKKFLLMIITASLLFLISCIDAEYLDYQRPNPPYDVELLKYESSYLLLFRSENRSNVRFGGFFIFIDDDPVLLKEEVNFPGMSDAEKAAFEADAEYNLKGKSFNTGRDAQIVVLFSDDASYNAGSTIEIGDTSYTIKTVLDMSGITAGLWLVVRTYLYEDDAVFDVSRPGNIVLIEP